MPVRPLPSQLLVGGVTRQPQIQRSPDHVQRMDNCVIDPALGTIKRAGTKHIAGETGLEALNVDTPTATDFFYHFVNRSADEQFVLLVSEGQGAGDDVQAYHLSGALAGDKFLSITLVGGAGENFTDYIALGASDVKDKMRAWTTADRTWFINSEAVPALEGSAGIYYYDGIDTATGTPLRDMDPNTTITMTTDHRCPNWTDLITSQPTGITAFTVGHHFWLDFDEVDRTAGVYKCISKTTQPWFEKVRTEGANYAIDGSHAPFILTMGVPFNGTLEQESWAERTSGDTATNPGPSLFDKGDEISACVFYQNRLWLGGKDNLLTSQTGAAENLWRDHMSLSIGSDPIDQLLTGPQVNNILRIQPLTTGALLVITDGGQQYEVRSSGGAFTPASTSIVSTTKFPSVDVQPVNLGDRTYFLGEAATGSKCYEYFIYDQEKAAQVTDISIGIPGYLPKNLKILAAGEAQEVLAFWTPDEANVIYLCQQRFSEGDRQLAAWHRWVFDPTMQIESFAIFGNTMYLIVRYDDTTGGSNINLYLESINIGPPEDDTGMGDSIRLDRRVDGVTGVYDSASNTTRWDLGFRDDTIDTVVLDSTWGVTQEPGTEPAVTNTVNANKTRMVANGDYSEGTAFVGRKFEQLVELSQPKVQDESGRNLEGSVLLKRLTINYETTTSYKVEVTAQGRETSTHYFTSSTLGGLGTLLGSPVEETGDFTCPIMAPAQDTTIVLRNPDARNATWATLQFTVNYNPRRVGRA